MAQPDEYATGHALGQDNIQPMGLLDVHNPVFLISGIAIVLFVVFTLSFPDSAAETFGELRPWLTTTFDWVFMSSVNFFIVFLVSFLVVFLQVPGLPFRKILRFCFNRKPYHFSDQIWEAF